MGQARVRQLATTSPMVLIRPLGDTRQPPLSNALDTTVTSTSSKVEDSETPKEVVPQPVTVATCPVYSEEAEAGRQTGAATLEKVMGAASVRIEKS